MLCAASGLRYFGVEIRAEEVEFCNSRFEALGLAPAAHVEVGDAREIDRVAPGVGDFLLTCPPYYDLERYNGGPDDLSGLASYEEFCQAMKEVASASYAALRPEALSVWVVGLHRDREGRLLPLHHDVAAAHTRAGFVLREEIIVYRRRSGAGARTRNFFSGRGFLARTHEYVLVFERGQG